MVKRYVLHGYGEMVESDGIGPDTEYVLSDDYAALEAAIKQKMINYAQRRKDAIFNAPHAASDPYLSTSEASRIAELDKLLEFINTAEQSTGGS